MSVILFTEESPYYVNSCLAAWSHVPWGGGGGGFCAWSYVPLWESVAEYLGGDSRTPIQKSGRILLEYFLVPNNFNKNCQFSMYLYENRESVCLFVSFPVQKKFP